MIKIYYDAVAWVCIDTLGCYSTIRCLLGKKSHNTILRHFYIRPSDYFVEVNWEDL